MNVTSGNMQSLVRIHKYNKSMIGQEIPSVNCPSGQKACNTPSGNISCIPIGQSCSGNI